MIDKNLEAEVARWQAQAQWEVDDYRGITPTTLGWALLLDVLSIAAIIGLVYGAWWLLGAVL